MFVIRKVVLFNLKICIALKFMDSILIARIGWYINIILSNDIWLYIALNHTTVAWIKCAIQPRAILQQ